MWFLFKWFGKNAIAVLNKTRTFVFKDQELTAHQASRHLSKEIREFENYQLVTPSRSLSNRKLELM